MDTKTMKEHYVNELDLRGSSSPTSAPEDNDELQTEETKLISNKKEYEYNAPLHTGEDNFNNKMDNSPSNNTMTNSQRVRFLSDADKQKIEQIADPNRFKVVHVNESHEALNDVNKYFLDEKGSIIKDPSFYDTKKVKRENSTGKLDKLIIALKLN